MTINKKLRIIAMRMILNPFDPFLQSINSIAPWLGQPSKQMYGYTTSLALN
jgi:hypothetical protein